MKEPKTPNNEANQTYTYSFRYDDLFEPQNKSLQLLSATVNGDMEELLTEVIDMLCAYELVENDQKYQKRFKKLVGEEVTREKVQEWLLGALIWKIERCLTIVFESGVEADATTGYFAPELTRAVKPEKAGQLYKEPIGALIRELVSIASQNHPTLINERTRRQQIAYGAITLITPFRLSAMLMGLLSNGFIATLSQPALPKFVELVERNFLSSLKQKLLPTRPPGDSRSHDPWEGRLPSFKMMVDDWFYLIEHIRKFSIEYKRKPWIKWINDDVDYIRLSKGRDQRWLEEAKALISMRIEQQTEANKSKDRAMLRKCRLSLGALGLTCDLATRMLNPPIAKPNGDSYDTERQLSTTVKLAVRSEEDNLPAMQSPTD